jgi:hypothetical protein
MTQTLPVSPSSRPRLALVLATGATEGRQSVTSPVRARTVPRGRNDRRPCRGPGRRHANPLVRTDHTITLAIQTAHRCPPVTAPEVRASIRMRPRLSLAGQTIGDTKSRCVPAEEPAATADFVKDQGACVGRVARGWVAGDTSRHCSTYRSAFCGPAVSLQGADAAGCVSARAPASQTHSFAALPTERVARVPSVAIAFPRSRIVVAILAGISPATQAAASL